MGFKKFDNFFCKIFKALTYVGGGIATAMMILSVLNVITRTFFVKPIFGTVEIISYAGLAMAALALAQNEMDEGNPVMTLLVDSFKPKTRALILSIAQILCTIFYAVCTVRFFNDIFTAIERNNLTTTLEMPLAIFYAFMCVGFFFLTFAAIIKCVRNFRKFLGKEDVQA